MPSCQVPSLMEYRVGNSEIERKICRLEMYWLRWSCMGCIWPVPWSVSHCCLGGAVPSAFLTILQFSYCCRFSSGMTSSFITSGRSLLLLFRSASGSPGPLSPSSVRMASPSTVHQPGIPEGDERKLLDRLSCVASSQGTDGPSITERKQAILDISRSDGSRRRTQPITLQEVLEADALVIFL